MKVFLGFNVTENKYNESLDGEIFITERIPLSQEKVLSDSDEKLESFRNRSELPVMLGILRNICGIIALVCFAATYDFMEAIPVVKNYVNSPVIYYALVISGSIFAVLAYFTYYKRRNVVESKDYTDALKESEEGVNSSYNTLGVPEDATDIEFLITCYKVKNGKIITKYDDSTEFIDVVLKVFLQDGALCLAEIRQKYTIPLESITGIRTIKKRISVPVWNKDISYKEGKYKQYNITANKNGQISYEPYYALCIDYNGEEYELYFPPYELPLIQKLTGTSMIE